jgi:hypothetical protein
MRAFVFVLIFQWLYGVVGLNHPQDVKVVGKIITETGEPVPRARIYFFPLDAEWDRKLDEPKDDLVTFTVSQNDGTFTYSLPHSFKRKYAVIVEMPPAVTPELINIKDYLSLSSEHKVIIPSKDVISLGNMKPDLKYARVVINVKKADYENYKHLPAEICLLDSKWDLIKRSKVQVKNIDSSSGILEFSLPSGEWRLNVFFKDDVSPKYFMTNLLCIRKETESLSFDLAEYERSKDIPFNKEEALTMIRQLGFNFTADDFLNRAAKSNTKAVELYLAAGMDPNISTPNGETALVFGIDTPEIVKLLLQFKANANVVSKSGMTPLIAASVNGNPKVVSLLIEGGAALDTKDSEGNTALMYAAWNGSTEIVVQLLKAGADLRIVNNQGVSALDFAKKTGEKDVIAILQDPGSIRKP